MRLPQQFHSSVSLPSKTLQIFDHRDSGVRFVRKWRLYPWGLIRHTSSNIANHLKTFFCICSHMPFACHVSLYRLFSCIRTTNVLQLFLPLLFRGFLCFQRNLPVLSICLLATQTAPLHEPILYALSKLVPEFINRSRFGVSMSVSPSSRIVS